MAFLSARAAHLVTAGPATAAPWCHIGAASLRLVLSWPLYAPVTFSLSQADDKLRDLRGWGGSAFDPDHLLAGGHLSQGKRCSSVELRTFWSLETGTV